MAFKGKPIPGPLEFWRWKDDLGKDYCWVTGAKSVLLTFQA